MASVMDEVLDSFLARLAGQPVDRPVVLGETEEGHELRAWRHVDLAGSASECVSVFVEVPDPPRGRVFVVLCRWSDEDEALAYSSVQEGADLPRWKALELLPGGVRVSVLLSQEDAPRVYDFKWMHPLTPPLLPT